MSFVGFVFEREAIVARGEEEEGGRIDGDRAEEDDGEDANAAPASLSLSRADGVKRPTPCMAYRERGATHLDAHPRLPPLLSSPFLSLSLFLSPAATTGDQKL